MPDPNLNPPISATTGALPGMLEICKTINQSIDWKIGLDQIVPYFRRLVLFDNLAIYQKSNALSSEFEVIYARAVGRGKTTGEYISWGDATAARVFDSKKVEINQPIMLEGVENNRLEYPFVLGMPINIFESGYVLILIRFGGPAYTPGDKQSIGMLACMLGYLLKQKQYQERLSMLEEQQKQSLLQEDFISTISHELISPIGFIKGYTTTLMRSDTTWTQDMQNEFLKIIDEETDRLQELIDNILDSARLQSGSISMDKQPVQIDTLIRDVVMRAKVHQGNLSIKTQISDKLPRVIGDPRRLTQVFENIISNAIKYAPGCNLLISVDVVEKNIHIAFKDDGPGVPTSVTANLFQKFYRNPNNPTETRGTGLGLYICKQIIDAHHGEIFAESEPSKGVTFHILLPIPANIQERGV